jgi:hypothetical protein
MYKHYITSKESQFLPYNETTWEVFPETALINLAKPSGTLTPYTSSVMKFKRTLSPAAFYRDHRDSFESFHIVIKADELQILPHWYILQGEDLVTIHNMSLSGWHVYNDGAWMASPAFT